MVVHTCIYSKRMLVEDIMLLGVYMYISRYTTYYDFRRGKLNMQPHTIENYTEDYIESSYIEEECNHQTETQLFTSQYTKCVVSIHIPCGIRIGTLYGLCMLH
jgi:hypothetical protein